MITKNLRSMLGHYRYKKEIRKVRRRPEIVSFDEAKSIGLLYNATDSRKSDFAKSYVKYIRGTYKKDVLAMGYVDRKSLPASQYAQFGLDYFCRKDLNFRMIPSNPIINNFINERYDILINLCPDRCFPLDYITAMSKARFKVGLYNKSKTDMYDMMVETNSVSEIKAIAEDIEHFLRLIKK